MDVAAALASLADEAAAVGVEIEIDHDDDVIWISSIRRVGPRRGSGGEVLTAVVELADEIGIPVRAAIVSSHDQLVDYYAGYGFEPVGGIRGRHHENIVIQYAP